MLEQFLSGFEPILIVIIESILIVTLAYLLKKIIIDRYLDRFARRAKIKKYDIQPVKTLASVVVYIVAFMLILTVMGFNDIFYGLLAGAGFAGIVVGFAVKDILANFIAGIIIFFDRPFKIGDRVEFAGVSGTVTDISIRSTRLMTWDGEYTTIPNSKVETEVVKNKSAPNAKIRLSIDVGVDYDSDMTKVIEACMKVLKSNKDVPEDPEPFVVFNEFGTSSINFKLRFWCDSEAVSPLKLKSEIAIALRKEFNSRGISIAFPHIEVMKHKRLP